MVRLRGKYSNSDVIPDVNPSDLFQINVDNGFCNNNNYYYFCNLFLIINFFLFHFVYCFRHCLYFLLYKCSM